MAKLKTIETAIQQVAKYIKDRKDGTVKSLRTGQKKLDSVMIDGIEWNSTVTIGGRPSVGKSAFSDILIDGCFENNLDENGKPTFDLLDFNWELSSRVMLIRRLSARMKKTYKYIISADNNELTEEELEEAVQILMDQYGKLPIVFCEDPLTTKNFAEVVRKRVESTGRNTLIRVDHTLLAKKSASEAGQVEMLLNLLMEANVLKKELPVIFMFLTQINREFEVRQEDGSANAYPKQGDVYGGDAAAMFSETMILLNKPAKYGITMYGKRNAGGILVAENDLFAHIVKNRNAEGDNFIHYKEHFKHMSIREQ